MSAGVFDEQITAWLLDGDPVIRYQTQRDLMRCSAGEITTSRSEILEKGWGKQIMDLQDRNGLWGNGLYNPKWTSTFYTLQLLKHFGSFSNEGIRKACLLILDKGYFSDRGINLSATLERSDTCVTGMFLAVLCFFGIDDERMHRLAEHLIESEMKDGGWNCEEFRGAKHSSFHTTLSVLEGLTEYEKMFDCNSHVTDAIGKGMEFLLQHSLYRSDINGRIIDDKMLRFTFPPGWRYDIMRALDFAQYIKYKKDERFSDAMNIIQKKRTKDGVWKIPGQHPGKVHFVIEESCKNSRWNTLRALRILKWWYY